MRPSSQVVSESGVTITINASYNCLSTHVCYLLECRICKVQYVGETETDMRTRSYSHRWQAKQSGYPLNYHLIDTGHSFNDFDVIILKGNLTDKLERRDFERTIINIFNVFRDGLNLRRGNW
jgi:hypothetical protein